MTDPPGGLIEVEVIYALPRAQTVIAVQLPAGSSVGDAIARSGIRSRHPEVDWSAVATGIFGTRVALSAVLREHDRVEIYRPLVADPKEARRQRARRRSPASR